MKLFEIFEKTIDIEMKPDKIRIYLETSFVFSDIPHIIQRKYKSDDEDSAGSVSYTHLDVYKRQAWSSNQRSNPLKDGLASD